MKLNLDTFSTEFNRLQHLPAEPKEPPHSWWKEIENLDELIPIVAQARRINIAKAIQVLATLFPKQDLRQIHHFLDWCCYQDSTFFAPTNAQVLTLQDQTPIF